MNRLIQTSLFLICLISSLQAQYPDRFIHYRSFPSFCNLWQNALEKYAEEDIHLALEIIEIAENKYINNKDWESLLFINNFKAQLLGEIGKPMEAIETLSRTRDKLKNRIDTLTSIEYAENLFLTGRVYTLLNNYAASEQFFGNTAKLLEQSGRFPEVVALAHFTLWQLYNKMMRSESAQESITKAINYLTATNSEYSKAILYFIQADRLDKNQLYLKADLFIAAAKAFEHAGSMNDFLYFTTLMKITQQFSSFQSNYALATHYGKMAEQYAVENRMSRAKSYGLNFALGDLYRSFNRYNEAIPYFIRAKEITLDIFGKQSLEYITANLYLGRLYRFMKEYEKASSCNYEVLKAGKTGWKGRFPHEFTLYGEFGRLYSSWNKPDSSLHFAQQRLAYEHQGKIFDLHEIPPTPRASSIVRYYNSIRVKIEAYKQLYLHTDDTLLLLHGLNHCHYALDMIDLMNEKALEEKSGLKNSNRAKLITTHAIFFSLELNKHRENEDNIKNALYFSERSNANYLKYLLGRKYIAEEQDNLEVIQLKARIDEIDLRLRNPQWLSQKQYDSIYNINIDKKLELANLVLNAKPKTSKVDNEYRLNPKIPVFNIDSIQSVIPNDGAILVYHIDNFEDDGEEPSPESVSDSKRLITFYIDRNRVYHTQNQLTPQHEIAFAEFLRSLKTGDNQNYMDMGLTLHQLLIEPVNHLLINKKKVTIIPDAFFADIPLESIPVNRKGATLCEKISTSYHYSLGLWSISKRKSEKPPMQSLAAFAPRFSTSEPNTRSLGSRSDDELIQSNTLLLPQLPMAEDEVIQIGKLFSTDKTISVRIEHDRITKKEFVSLTPKFDIIHIASHGFADLKDFRNSGIYFSDSSNTGYELLHLNEVYNMNLQANLVVLSACKTNVGKIIQGEGSMALPRGFIYAGVPNVIASLWKVHDEKTKNLMIAFYRHLLKGNSYANALRLAKLDCIRKGYLPLDWAGFVLIGE